MKILLILIFLLQIKAKASCYYIDCMPLVASNLQAYKARSTAAFAKLTLQKKLIQKKYEVYVEELDHFIELQIKDTKLKTEMILELKKKEVQLQSRIKMHFLKTKNKDKKK
jgi:hypothetical protein